MALNLLTPPVGEPILLDEMKDHLRISIDDDDKVIKNMITVAREWSEETWGRAYMAQTWDLYLDGFPKVPYSMPYPPLSSITHIKYTDTDEDETEVATTVYRSDIYSVPGRINLKDGQAWPSVTLQSLNGVVIRFVAGYGDRYDVKEKDKQAIKLLVGHLYEHREETTSDYRTKLQSIPLGIYSLLDTDRVTTFP